MRVVATDGFDTEAAELLKKQKGIELTIHAGVPATELNAALHHADLVIIRSATVLNRAVMEKLPQLKGVLRAGVGIDNVDVRAAEELGIWVWNAPTGNFQATAELALALLLSCSRRIVYATEGAREQKWLKKDIGSSGRQLQGSTLGIFGAGNIGTRLGRMAQGIGMKVIVCDPVYAGHDFEKVDFETLLQRSDMISLHAPLVESTRHAFKMESFRRMKKGMILVNAARGGIIRDADLLPALEEGFLSAVGLDVFESEPWSADYAALLKDPRVVATPHMGASTKESQRFVGLEAAEKISALQHALEGKGSAPRPLNHPAWPRWSLTWT